jgi:DNA-binding LacI/PurR family transcriptional regulator
MRSVNIAVLARQMIEKFLSEPRSEGDAFWSERDTAGMFKVTRHQARKAVDWLVRKKVLSRKPGSGTFLCSKNLNEGPGIAGQRPHPCEIIPDWDIELATGFIAAFKRAFDLCARQRGWPVSFYHEGSIQDEPHFIQRLIAGGINCVVFVDIHGESIPAATTLLQAGIPVVSFGRDLAVLKSLKIPVVSQDDRAAMQDLAMSLLARGRERIVLAGISDPIRTNEHLQGFAAACRLLGREYPADMVVEGYDIEYVVRSLRRRFAAKPPPDAILFEEGISFLKVLEAMPELREAIRSGLTAAVFDELYLDEKLPDLPVVSVRIPAEIAGRTCVEIAGLALAGRKIPRLTRLRCSILCPPNPPVVAAPGGRPKRPADGRPAKGSRASRGG